MTRQAAYKKRKPWVRYVEWARRRCHDPAYRRYSNYGGRGIKCELSAADAEFLWKRDAAHLLKKPSLDRVDANMNYTRENCRFIEFLENIRAPHLASTS